MMAVEMRGAVGSSLQQDYPVMESPSASRLHPNDIVYQR